ncbi:MAG: hypothetical protein KC503_26395 [Myxococcales bacterium]|nr:hypothetical protein [Myxococcales bacterium]
MAADGVGPPGDARSDTADAGRDAEPADTRADSLPPDLRVPVPCTPPGPTYQVSASDVVDLMQTRCDGSRCHVGGFAAGLDMRREVFFDNTVGIPSNNSPLLRIHPGQPSRSFLYLKLTGQQAGAGRRMPSGGPYLGSAELSLVRRFIEDCAHEGAVAGAAVGP